MHLLGRHLPDHQRLMYALKAFYGLSHPLSRRLLARLSIPEQALVSDITETQITALSGYLSSPAASTPPAPTPLAAPIFGASSSKLPRAPMPSEAQIKATNAADPLNFIQVESDLRRTLHANLQHLRAIGTYRGRRHAMGFPARGQNTRSNAHTALRLNRINRRNFSSSRVLEALGYTEVPQPPSDILRLLGKQ